jgi:hypothetical protein
MKNTIKLFFVVAICLIAANLYSLSDGAFNVTGAPGSGDCTGCHLGTANSDPKGSVNISIDSSNGFYEPGKVYPVKVTVNYEGKGRFGFALSTRQAGFDSHIGEFIAASGSGIFNRIEYVAHTKASIDEPNQKTWSFRWKAPTTSDGDITFYAAGVASNADDKNTGDLVYTKSLTLKKATGNFVEMKTEDILKKCVVFPIPCSDFIWIKNIPLTSIEEAVLISNRGEEIKKYSVADFTDDNSYTKLFLGSNLNAGIYMLKVKHNQNVSYIKLVVL